MSARVPSEPQDPRGTQAPPRSFLGYNANTMCSPPACHSRLLHGVLAPLSLGRTGPNSEVALTEGSLGCSWGSRRLLQHQVLARPCRCRAIILGWSCLPAGEAFKPPAVTGVPPHPGAHPVGPAAGSAHRPCQEPFKCSPRKGQSLAQSSKAGQTAPLPRCGEIKCGGDELLGGNEMSARHPETSSSAEAACAGKGARKANCQIGAREPGAPGGRRRCQEPTPGPGRHQPLPMPHTPPGGS